jgi:hypothetical protein
MELNNYDELVVIKRITKFNNLKMATNSMLKLSRRGRFHLSKIAAKTIGVDLTQPGIMFAFNYSAKKAYIFKENESDSFIVRKRNKEDQFNFTSVLLAEHFIKCFSIKILPVCFDLGNLELKNDKIMYPLNLI